MKKMKKLTVMTSVGVFAVMAIAVMLRPDQMGTNVAAEPASTADPVGEPVGESLQLALDLGLPLGVAEEVVVFAENIESAVLRDGDIDMAAFDTAFAEYAERMVTAVESNRDVDPELLPYATLMPKMPNPGELAEGRYDSKWQEFIADMDIADEEAVRDIVTRWEEFNIEISRQLSAGIINGQQYANAKLTVGDLQDSLASQLSRDQLQDVAVNEEFYWENFRREQFERQREMALAGYTTGIINAAAENDLAAVRDFVQSGADVNTSTTDGRWTALREAAYAGNVEMAQYLIQAGADVNWASINGRTALTEAAEGGNLGLVRLLASEGANLEGADITPLKIAVMFNRTEVVKELINLGADVSGEKGGSALSWASNYGNQEMEQMLRNAGASRVAWIFE